MAVENLLMKTRIMVAGAFRASVTAPVRLCHRRAFVFRFALSGIAGLVWLHILATKKLPTQKVARQSPVHQNYRGGARVKREESSRPNDNHSN
jgi:hypothetical protein